MKTYVAVIETANRRVVGKIGSLGDWHDFVVRLRAFVREEMDRRPESCIGVALAFHPLDYCEHDAEPVCREHEAER